MQTISQILTFPNGTPIDSVQGNLVSVYDHKPFNGKFGPTTVQAAVLQDVAGIKIPLSVWDHPDLAPLKGTEVVLHNTKGKGVEVKHSSYEKNGQTVNKIELSVGRSGCFQHVETYKSVVAPQRGDTCQTASTPAPASPQQTNGIKPILKPIHGASVGMAINKASDYLIANGLPLEPKEVHRIASGLVRVAMHIEAGKLFSKEDPVPAKEPVPGPMIDKQPAPAPSAKEPISSPAHNGPVEDEDVPF